MADGPSSLALLNTMPALRPALPVQEDGPAPFSRVPGIIGRNKLRILMLGLGIGVPLAVIASLVPPHYVATATVRVDTRQAESETEQSDFHIATDAVAIRTQVDVLKSVSLARTVVQRLDLTSVPEFGGPTHGPTTLAMQIQASIARLQASLGIVSPPLTADQRVDQVANKLIEDLTFVNDERSYVIGISASTGDPVLSARIANAYAAAFLDYTRQQKIDAVQRANAWFDARLQVLQKSARDSNVAVQTLRAKTGIVEDPAIAGSGGSPVTVAGQQLAQINSEMVAAAADRAEKQATYSQIQSTLHGQTSLEGAPAVMQSPLISQLRSQELELDSQVANLSATRAANYPGLQSLISAQRSMHARLSAEVEHVAQSVASEARAAQAREDALRSALNQAKAQVGSEGADEIRVGELQSEADAARTIYMNYLDLYQKTSSQVGLQQPDASLVSTATPPLKPAMPTPHLLAAIGVLLGLVAALFLVVRRALSRGGFRTGEELEARTMLPTLATIPRPRRRQAGAGGLAGLRDPATSLRLALLPTGMHRSCQVIMVTSALPGEGKTFTSVSLARNAQAAGRSVLVIDCDLHRPSVASALGAKAMSIADFVHGGVEDLAAETANGIQRVSVVAAALPGGVAAPSSAMPEIEHLIERARAHYDLVLLDVPSVLVSVEAQLLAPLADMVVMVVAWAVTPTRMVLKATELLSTYGARIRGTVLNNVAVEKLAPSESSIAYVQRRYPNHFTA